MATEVKFRRGTTAEHASFTGADGEVTFDTDKNVWVMHDGLTAGGFPLPTQINPYNAVTAGGTDDELTLTLTPATAAYADNQIFAFEAASNNTGSATLNVDALGAKTIKKNAGADDLDADDLVAGGKYTVWYDGANLQLTGGAIGGGGGTKEFFVPVTAKNSVTPVYPYSKYGSGAESTEVPTSNLTVAEEISFIFHVPNDFTSLIDAVVVSTFTGTGPQTYDLFSDYAADGQDHDIHTETVANATFAGATINQVGEFDVSGVLSAIAAGDYVGLNFEADTVNTSIYGLRIRYS